MPSGGKRLADPAALKLLDKVGQDSEASKVLGDHQLIFKDNDAFAKQAAEEEQKVRVAIKRFKKDDFNVSGRLADCIGPGRRIDLSAARNQDAAGDRPRERGKADGRVLLTKDHLPRLRVRALRHLRALLDEERREGPYSKRGACQEYHTVNFACP